MSSPVLPGRAGRAARARSRRSTGGLAALTVVADGDGLPFGPQALLDEARQCPLVLDDQDARFKHHLMRRRGRIGR